MTRAGHLTDLGVALGRVFVHPSYVLLAGVLAILTFLLAVLFPNVGLIGGIGTSGVTSEQDEQCSKAGLAAMQARPSL